MAVKNVSGLFGDEATVRATLNNPDGTAEFKQLYGSASGKSKAQVESVFKDIKGDLEFHLASLGNLSALPEGERTPALQAEIDRKQSIVDGIRVRLFDFVEALPEQNFTVPENTELVATTSAGNIIPASDVEEEAPGTTAAGAQGRAGEAVNIQQQADGSYSIIGADSGEVLQEGIGTVQEANALATQLQAGSTPSVAGAPDVFAVDPTLEEETAAVEAGEARVATTEELIAGEAEPTATQVRSIEDLERLAALGLTESDITRQGQAIFLKPGITAESLTTRSGVAGTQAGAGLIDAATGADTPQTGTGTDTVTDIVPVGDSASDIALSQMRTSVLGEVVGDDDIAAQEAALLGTIGEGLISQEQALRELPETIRERTEDVGVTQGQLNRLVATEAEPIAQALKDLLLSRSLLQEQISFRREETALEAAAEQQEFENILALETLGIQKETLALQSETSDIKEYNFATEQGFDGSFLDYLTLTNADSSGTGLTDNQVLTAAVDLIEQGVETNLPDAIDHINNALTGRSTPGEPGSEDLPAVKTDATLSLGNGTITGYGSELWEPGLDFVLEGGKGAEVAMPFDFEVISTNSNTGFGNQVRVQTLDGQEIWFSHLDDIALGSGSYEAGTIIGTQGNSGNTYSLTGGDGTHLDITMPKVENASTSNLDNFYTAEQVAQFWNAQEVTGEKVDILTKAELQRVNDLADDLRSEPLYSDMLDVLSGFQAVDTGVGLNNSQGDLMLVNGFQRMIDPGAVVREGEFATVEEAQGFIQSTLNTTAKVVEGSRLTEDARGEFLKAAEALYTNKVGTYNSFVTDRFEDRAAAANVPFNLIGNAFPSLSDLRSTTADGGIGSSNSDPLGVLTSVADDPLGIRN